jgi:hypothetical protein
MQKLFLKVGLKTPQRRDAEALRIRKERKNRNIIDTLLFSALLSVSASQR